MTCGRKLRKRRGRKGKKARRDEKGGLAGTRLSHAPGMKARERGVDHVRSLPANVQQHQAAVGEEPVHAEGVLGVAPPGTVRELVKIRVGRHEEELLVVTAGLVSSSDPDDLPMVVMMGSSFMLAARGRIARGGQCGRRLVDEIGWHSDRIRRRNGRRRCSC